jgi:REP element-mobilizing transposase RayT
MAAQLQLSLPVRPTWGGKRAGAGRKPNRARPGVSHLKRAPLDPRHPVHVTQRVHRGVPNLRHPVPAHIIANAIRSCRAQSFTVIHVSIQRDHLHFIVEADGGDALSRGMHLLDLRIARGINRRLGRRGPVFVDRYHGGRRILAEATAREMRRRRLPGGRRAPGELLREARR